jgi:hypothetical protein
LKITSSLKKKKELCTVLFPNIEAMLSFWRWWLCCNCSTMTLVLRYVYLGVMYHDVHGYQIVLQKLYMCV